MPSTPRPPLPIDPLLPELVERLRRSPSLVLEAPTGAGKTTRAPVALLEAGLTEGEIVVLEPRRLAARLAARRVAAELGERPGETVGWQVRFEDVSGPRTRLKLRDGGAAHPEAARGADPSRRGGGGARRAARAPPGDATWPWRSCAACSEENGPS